MGLESADRVLVTTFGDSEEKQSVQRVVCLADQRVACWLADPEDWAERLSVSPTVTVRACSTSGKPVLDEPLLEGRAQLLTDGVVFDEAREATHAKYGLGTTIAGLLDKAKETLSGTKTPEAVVVIDIVG